jgi:hypothetical protein
MMKEEALTVLMSSQRMFKLRVKTRLVIVDERDEEGKEKDKERELRVADRKLRSIRVPACAFIQVLVAPACNLRTKLPVAVGCREDATSGLESSEMTAEERLRHGTFDTPLARRLEPR